MCGLIGKKMCIEKREVDPFVREPFEKLYELHRHVATSTFGRVYECRQKNGIVTESKGGCMLLVKMVPKEAHPLIREATTSARKRVSINGDFSRIVEHTTEDRPEEAIEFRNYMSQLLRLDHRHVVRYQQFVADCTNFYFVMERCHGVELVEHLLIERTWCESMGRAIIRQTLEALRYIHDDIGLVHRDVKLENLMVQRLGAEPGTRCDVNLKLVDFGLGCQLASASGTVGTPGYIAPECFARRGSYGANADVFSAGVVLYILFTGSPPFRAPVNIRHISEHLKTVWDGPDVSLTTSKVSQSGCDLLDSMLLPNPASRISSAEAVQHPWFQMDLGCDERVLWHSSASEVQFLKVMGMWSGSGSKSSSTIGRGHSLDKIQESAGGDEEELLEALCSSVVHMMPTAVCVADPTKGDCPIVAVSRGFTALTGFREDDIVGRNCRFLSAKRTKEVLPETREGMRRATREHTPFLGVVPNCRADGSNFSNLLHISPLDIGSKVFLLGVQMKVEEGTVFEEERHRREALDVVRKAHGAIRHWIRSSQGRFAARKLVEVSVHSPKKPRSVPESFEIRRADSF